MLLHHFLEHSASKYPDKTAIIHEDSRVSYQEINAGAENLADFLKLNMVSKGDRVVLLLGNSIQYVIAYYAILKSGAIAVPLSSELKPDGLIPLLKELEPVAIISSFRFERLLLASNISDSKVKLLILDHSKQPWNNKKIIVANFQDILSEHPTTKKVDIKSSDLASIIYTSGSTGTPKGVMLTHGNLVANTNSICQYLKLRHEDIQMVVLPFFYVMGKSLLNTLVAVGGTVVINNQFAFPAAVINQMIGEKVTLFSGVPSTYAYLLHRSPLKKKRSQLESLRMVTQAGGHMSRVVKISLRKALPDRTRICIMYGATEASARLTWLDPQEFEHRIDSIGKAIPGVNITIRDAQGNELSTGETGELVASGANIMQGYWKDPHATLEVLDQWGYHTGDLGFKDGDGFIFLEGRKDDLIKVGGHRINPQEVEDALMETGRIVESAVVGVPDDLLGTQMVAVVVAIDAETTKEMIMQSCSTLLPKYKLPSKIKLVRALPKNANGKIDRGRCLELLNK